MALNTHHTAQYPTSLEASVQPHIPGAPDPSPLLALYRPAAAPMPPLVLLLKMRHGLRFGGMPHLPQSDPREDDRLPMLMLLQPWSCTVSLGRLFAGTGHSWEGDTMPQDVIPLPFRSEANCGTRGRTSQRTHYGFAPQEGPRTSAGCFFDFASRATPRAGLSLRDQIFFFLLRTAPMDRPKGPPTASRQLPPTANRHQPQTATNRQPSTAANRQQPPIPNCQLPPTAANRCQPPPANHSCQPPIATNHG